MEPQPTQKTSSSKAVKITIFLLLLFYPLGIIVMWFWPKWKLWVKLALTVLPIILGIVYLSLITYFVDPTLSDKLRPLNNCIDACAVEDNPAQCKQICREKFVEENSFIR